jgi:hypothetical protein
VSIASRELGQPLTIPPTFSPRCMIFVPRVGLLTPPIGGCIPSGRFSHIVRPIWNSDSAVSRRCATVRIFRRAVVFARFCMSACTSVDPPNWRLLTSTILTGRPCAFWRSNASPA